MAPRDVTRRPLRTRARGSVTSPTRPKRRPSQVGTLLQYWRDVRGMSQLALAIEADVSPRHVSFVETGRAQPSREMVLQLATALEVPLREQNGLLLAAGFAPIFRESHLDAPELRAVRVALDAILAKQEPYPAVVMNRAWDILMTNAAATRFFGHLLDDAPVPSPLNVVRMMFDPVGLRPCVSNWEAVAESLVRRMQREAVGGVPDEATVRLLADVLAYPGVPDRWSRPDPDSPLVPVIPVVFLKHARTYTFFSAVTTLGTPQDVTLQELRIECFFPMDAETDQNVRTLMPAT
jgi:transcriptional regulator with XRE-family HTH domain